MFLREQRKPLCIIETKASSSSADIWVCPLWIVYGTSHKHSGTAIHITPLKELPIHDAVREATVVLRVFRYKVTKRVY